MKHSKIDMNADAEAVQTWTGEADELRYKVAANGLPKKQTRCDCDCGNDPVMNVVSRPYSK